MARSTLLFKLKHYPAQEKKEVTEELKKLSTGLKDKMSGVKCN